MSMCSYQGRNSFKSHHKENAHEVTFIIILDTMAALYIYPFDTMFLYSILDDINQSQTTRIQA